jgi:pSer/pThr/pTyr-binding forkhead associated (FHA) protein
MAVIVQLHEGVAINKFVIFKPVLRIGRDPESDIYVDNDVVSAEHAVIERVEGAETKGSAEYYIQDIGSTNCTYLNGKKVVREKLEHNDMLRIGFTSFKFVDDSKGNPEKTTKIHKSWIPGVYYTKK